MDTRDLEARLLAAEEDDTTLVVGSWAYSGTGWPRIGDEALTVAAAARAREYANGKPPAARTTTTERTRTMEDSLWIVTAEAGVR